MAMIIELNNLGKIIITTVSGEVITIKLKDNFIGKAPLYISADKDIRIRNIKRDDEEVRSILGNRYKERRKK